MARIGSGKGGKRAMAALLAAACAGIGLTLPGVSLAVGGPAGSFVKAPAALAGLPFTPAKVDPGLALKVARIMGGDGLRFTPAAKTARTGDRTVTVAVRVDRATARAITVRQTLDSVGEETRAPVVLAATRYNLGIARGYQSFVQPKRTVTLADSGVSDLRMPDLATLRPEADRKPGRFQPRIALEQTSRAGRSEGTLTGVGEQSIDVRGAYRLGRNLDLTAGVRLSQERDRLAPMTDGVEDDQAVYVGTQIKF